MSELAVRREEERGRRRAEIIEAAEVLYAERGWDLVAIDQVARAARLSRALVYVYFRDKDDLLLAIASRGLEHLAARFREASSKAGRGRAKIEAIGRAYLSFAFEETHLFDACMRAQTGRGTASERPSAAACEAAGRKVDDVVMEALRLGLADGSIRRDLGEVERVSVALWAFTHGLAQVLMAKKGTLEDRGIQAAAFTESALGMLDVMLTPPGGQP